LAERLFALGWTSVLPYFGQASLLKANSRVIKPIVHNILMCRAVRGKTSTIQALKVSNGV